MLLFVGGALFAVLLLNILVGANSGVVWYEDKNDWITATIPVWNVSVVMGAEDITVGGFRQPYILSNDSEPLGLSCGSASMLPIRCTDKLLVDFGAEDYTAGDIVGYAKGKKVVLHRIKSIAGEIVIAQGDNNAHTDKPFTRDDIVFVVRGVVYG